MPQLIQMKVIGDKAVMRELHALQTTALPTNIMKGIFMRVMKPMEREAKSNARNIRKEKAQLTKTGRLAKRYTKKGNTSGSYKHGAGRHMAKAIKLARFRGNKFPGVNISVRQKLLPAGRGGIRVGHMLERGINYGTKGRRGRRHFNQYPIYKAFNKYKKGTQKGAERLIIKQLQKFTRKTPHIHFSNSSFGIN